MNMRGKMAVIFGGTGFVGRHIVRDLAAAGVRVKIASRVPESGYFLKPCGDIGQVVPVYCDYSDYDSIASVVEGADYVVNCVGILYERKKGDFERVHAALPESIATACAVAGVARFVQISALGADVCGSEYAKTKMEGEKRLTKAFPKAVILRPSVIFGEEDAFFNKFAALAELLPFLPLIGGGETKFQPVFVGDVAAAVMQALGLPATSKHNPEGQVYELGGPDVVSFKDIYEILFAETGRERPLMNLSFGIAKMQAHLLKLLPDPLLTPDQVESLKWDSVVSAGAKGFADLKMAPTAMGAVLPTYLSLYRPGGRFAGLKAA